MEEMKPLVYDVWPEQSMWDSIKDKFSDIADKASEWFKNTFGRRLVGNSNY